MSVSSPNGILTFPNATLRTSELQCNTLSLEEITFNVSRGFENVINTSNVSSKAVHISNTQAATSTTVGALRVDGGIACGGNLWCANLVVQGVDVEVGALDLQQVMVAGNTTARPMNITNTTATTGYTTGALTVSGGVGINSSLNVSGDVGIGTASPQAKLDVNGGFNVSGDVGIGTTSPQAKLDVNGGFNVSGDVGIGTTSPSHKLNVHAPSGDAEVHIQAQGNSGDAIIYFNGSSTNQRKCAILCSNVAPASWCRQDLHFCHNTSENYDDVTIADSKMVITNSGNIGIGTDEPIAKFHVNGVDGRIWGLPVRSFADDYALTYNATAYYGDPSVSIWASGKIFAGDVIGSVGGTITASDERIKTNITDINDGDALATLRLLKPKKYQYKDTIKRGTEPVWGFIAQEVANTLPYSTQTTINTLPNIYEMANVYDSNVITFTNFDTSSLESNASVIKVNAKDGTDHLVKLVEVINEHTIRVGEDLSEWIGSIDENGNVVAGNQLFIYGQEVDDFVFLKKDAIWTVATAALQEVDRQLQDTKAQLASVLARLDALEGNA
jgi:hypothetical protein